MPTVRDATVCLLRELGMTTIFGNPFPVERHGRSGSVRMYQL